MEYMTDWSKVNYDIEKGLHFNDKAMKDCMHMREIVEFKLPRLNNIDREN